MKLDCMVGVEDHGCGEPFSVAVLQNHSRWCDRKTSGSDSIAICRGRQTRNAVDPYRNRICRLPAARRIPHGLRQLAIDFSRAIGRNLRRNDPQPFPRRNSFGVVLRRELIPQIACQRVIGIAVEDLLEE